MPQYAYLDTNAFRYLGTAFRDETLAEELRKRVLISPLSAFEVFAQLTDENDGDTVLSQVKAVRNWVNPQHCGLLPWPGDMLYQLWFRTPVQDDEFARKMTLSFNRCLSARSVEEIKEESLRQKEVMAKCKRDTAQQFKNMIDGCRNGVDFERAWFLGIARRVHADPNSRAVSEIVSIFDAYYEFEKSKLRGALADRRYNPLSKKNQNDAIDSEQLVYLGDPKLCMLTSDKGMKSKVAQSNQASRIITVLPGDLMDPQEAQHVVGCTLSV